MNITTDLDQVSPDYDKPREGYEWWYFDGISEDGEYSFVIIFYHDNPFSTRKIKELEEGKDQYNVHPAISISIYRNKKTIYYSFLEYDETRFDWDADNLLLTIGNDRFQYDLDKERFSFEINLDQVLPSGYSLKGQILGNGDLTKKKLMHSESKDRHLWNLILPSLTFNMDLKVSGTDGENDISVKGKGYHDHNIGEEPMKDSFRDWYWGRFHFQDYTLIFYLMEKYGERQFQAWLIDDANNEILESFKDAKMNDLSKNTFGLNSARKIELKTSQATVNIALKDKIDNGPFYQRFLGEAIINYKGQINAAQGIAEYIYPENIYNRLFWPLVHMRLNYTNEKIHWVQKSPLMYPWTW